MSYNPKSYRKFLTATVTAAVVTSMVAPSVIGFIGTVIIKGTQPQYYLDAEHSNQ